MGNSFKIKVRSENDEVNEISINSLDKIKNIKSIICSLQKKYIQRYLLIYKGNQLLEDENTVSSYNIIPNETLTYKSSKKIYLIFFSEYKKKAGKYSKFLGPLKKFIFLNNIIFIYRDLL